MIYINIEKKVAITRLSLPVLSIQIMFSFYFSLYFDSFKYYKYYYIIIIYVSRNYKSICIYLFHMTFLGVLCIYLSTDDVRGH
jgi:hypothetical protein